MNNAGCPTASNHAQQQTLESKITRPKRNSSVPIHLNNSVKKFPSSSVVPPSLTICEQYKSAQQTTAARQARGLLFNRQQQNPIRPAAFMHQIKTVSSSLREQPVIRQQKLIRQVIFIEPATPPQLPQLLELGDQQHEFVQSGMIGHPVKYAVPPLKLPAQQNHSVQPSIPEKSKDQHKEVLRKRYLVTPVNLKRLWLPNDQLTEQVAQPATGSGLIRPQPPGAFYQQHKAVPPPTIVQVAKKPMSSVLLHQLASVVRRRQTTNSLKSPVIQTSNLKHVGKHLSAQRSRVCFEKTSTVQLSQTAFVGKVKKSTAPNVQQRQFIEQTKKYMTMYPQDLRAVKKPGPGPGPQQPEALVVQQTSAPVVLQLHQSQNTTDFNSNPIIQWKKESEDELRCAICTEIFIEAQTLSCSHTYCKYCITQWRKNRPSCPICNIKISKEYPTRVIDNYIEKILQKASEQVKEHRRQVIAQRLAASHNIKKKRLSEFPIGTSARDFA